MAEARFGGNPTRVPPKPPSQHIAHVAPYYWPHVGGVESHVEAVVEEFARRGHRVTVVTTRLPGSAASERRNGVDILRVEPTATLFDTPIAPRTAPEVAALRADVVHTHSPPPLTSWFAALGAEKAGTPIVHTHHCDLELPVPGGRLAVETYRRTFGRRTLARASAVLATTQSYANTSRDLWKRPVRVVPNPVDAARFHPGVDGSRVRDRHRLGDRKVALFVGRLTHHKGVEHFVRAAESSPADVVHLVVGDGPRRRSLEAMAREMPRGKVVFAGRVPHEELPAYYGAADIAALPSTSRLEAFGIAALEAMASARPVVATDIPGVTEVVEDGVTGLLVEPFSPGVLGRALGTLAGDDKRREAMGLAARERVLARFTTEKVVDALEAVYSEVQGKTGSTQGASTDRPVA